MRVLISANGPTWNAIVDPAFENAPFWLLVDPDAEALDALPAESRPSLSTLAVEAIITGHVGGKTLEQAAQAGIPIYSIPAGGIRIACRQWQRGRLTCISAPQQAVQP